MEPHRDPSLPGQSSDWRTQLQDLHVRDNALAQLKEAFGGERDTTPHDPATYVERNIWNISLSECDYRTKIGALIPFLELFPESHQRSIQLNNTSSIQYQTDQDMGRMTQQHKLPLQSLAKEPQTVSGTHSDPGDLTHDMPNDIDKTQESLRMTHGNRVTGIARKLDVVSNMVALYQTQSHSYDKIHNDAMMPD